MKLIDAALKIETVTEEGLQLNADDNTMAQYCPNCTSVRLKRDRFKWYEWPLVVVLCRPFKCPHCFRRMIRPVQL